MSGTTPNPVDAVEVRLDELERESLARRDELRAIAASLPAATSRRAVLASMVRGFAAAPDKPTVARRVVRKLLRSPGELVRRRRAG